MDNNQLLKENERLRDYNYSAGFENANEEQEFKKGNEGLSYQALNSRYIDLEKTYDAESYSKHEKKRSRNKEIIENYWHTSSEEEAKNIIRSNNGDRTNPAYYESFDLKTMEALLKNSNRGGNSGLYNDVVTDLELLNNAEKNDINHEEIVTISLRLEESCDKYISNRNPFFKEGKIRKALITALNGKLRVTKQSLKSDVTNSMEAFRTNSEQTEEGRKNLEEATKANYNLITQYLQGNIELSKEEVLSLDINMGNLFAKMKEKYMYPVDRNQNKDLNTQFFNAIGWTSRNPRLVEINSEETLKGPRHNIYLYHTISATTDIDDATPMAQQLMGVNKDGSRHYMSNGYAGKGTYLAANKQEKDPENRASNDSWNYGSKKGSVQVTMAFNEKTRLVQENYLKALWEKKKKLFPSLLKQISGMANGSRSGDASLSIIGALFGYNVTQSNSEQDSFPYAYYVAYDRSALSIDKFIRIALQDNVKSENYEAIDDKSIFDTLKESK